MIIKVNTQMRILDNLGFRFFSKLNNFIRGPIIEINKFPVIINNYNRLDCLKKQINWLESINMNNIFIIDNNSSYPKLIAYYKSLKYPVFVLNKNIGFLALWKTVIFQLFKNDYYIYTDPDILPIEQCPKDVIYFFFSLLQKYPDVDKVGFGLKIDDLSSNHILKNQVFEWEKKYWEHEIEPSVFKAPIDTTFALYRPGVKGGSELPAIRTGGKYIARHLTWYLDHEDISQEDLQYIESSNNSSSWGKTFLNKSLKYKS